MSEKLHQHNESSLEKITRDAGLIRESKGYDALVEFAHKAGIETKYLFELLRSQRVDGLKSARAEKERMKKFVGEKPSDKKFTQRAGRAEPTQQKTRC